jgi:hypothetical protein
MYPIIILIQFGIFIYMMVLLSRLTAAVERITRSVKGMNLSAGQPSRIQGEN